LAGPSKPLVTVAIFLFGKPAWEIERLEGSTVTPELLGEVAACGEELSRRLSRAAQVGKRLLDAGWEGLGLVYGIDFYKAITLKETQEELKDIGVNPDEVSIKQVDGPEGDSEKG